MSRQLFVKISNSANTIQFLTVSPDYNTLLINACNDFRVKITSFVRITDSYLGIKDDKTLQYIYDQHLKNHKDDDEELVLVGLEENEVFTQKELEYFKLADYSKISNLIKNLKNAESVDICFLADTTYSMTPYVKQVKNVITAANSALRTIFPDIKLRSAFIGYGDYDKNGKRTNDQIIVKPFTSNVTEFEKNIEEIKFSGGGDEAEDVFGGLEQVPKLAWLNSSRVLFHMADAPCHGRAYYDTTKFKSDDHPKGDPKGLNIKDLLKNIFDKGIDYYFTRINDTTDIMIEVFNKEIDLLSKRNIRKYELKQDQEILNSLVTSLTFTIGNTQTLSMLYDEQRESLEPKNKEIKRDTLNFKNDSHLKEHDAEIYEFIFNGTLEDIKEMKRNYDKKITDGKKIEVINIEINEKINIVRKPAKIKLSESPFSKGNLRYAYACKIKKEGEKDFKEYVAKNSLFKNGSGDRYENMKRNIYLQLLAKYFAEEFLKESKSVIPVKFLNVFLIQLADTFEYYSIEDYLDGTFQKWNGSLGMINPTIYSSTLVSFSHWIYEKTDHYMIVNDLQGFRRGSKGKEEYVLTDPAISCIQRQFTGTDLGQFGIIKYFEKHECNSHCKRLELSQKVILPDGRTIDLPLRVETGTETILI